MSEIAVLGTRHQIVINERFAAVIMRIREPKTTALIYASGKMVCTGAKSEEQSRLAARKYARIIQKLGFPAKFKNFKIQNIVGSCDVKFPIRLEGLAYTHGSFSSVKRKGIVSCSMFRSSTIRHCLLTRLFFTKPPALLSTTAAAADAKSPENDTVSQILAHFNRPCSPRFLINTLRNKVWFNSGVFGLEPYEIDTVIENLGSENAIEFFFLLENALGIRHSINGKLIIAHLLAGTNKPRALRCHLQRVVGQERGPGSSRSFCDLLCKSFSGWGSTHMVWDMLAFVYSRIGMVYDALSVLSKMKDLDVQPSIMTYNSLLHNLRHTDIMWDIYSKIEATGSHFANHYTNSIFLDGLCRQSLMHEAIAFLCEIEEKETEPCLVWFNTLMSGFCRMGFVDTAKSFFSKLFKCGLIPDIYSYNILIHGLCVTGSLEEALDFIHDMQNYGLEPDEVTYNTLAKGFHGLGMMDTDGSWVQNGLGPTDDLTYTMLYKDSMIIHGLCKMGESQKAIQLYNEMHVKSIILNSFPQKSSLLGLFEKRPISEARNYFNVLTNSELAQDVVLYNIMIDRYVKLGCMEEALKLYQKLLDKGISPTVVTFNTLINGFCKAQKLIAAGKWLGVMKMHNLSPNIVTYTTLMNAYCEAGNLEAAYGLIEDMNTNGLEPNQVTYTVVMKGLCKIGKLEEAVLVLRGMLEKGSSPDQASYNALIQCFCKARDLDKALQLYDEMVRLNINPNSVTYVILINGLCVYGGLSDAERVFSFLQDQNIRLPKVAYTTLVKAVCAKGDILKAKLLFSQMIENGFESSVRDYSAVINRLCKRVLLDDAMDFFRMMLVDRVVPDWELCSVMMQSFNRAGCFGFKSQVYGLMVKYGLDRY